MYVCIFMYRYVYRLYISIWKRICTAQQAQLEPVLRLCVCVRISICRSAEKEKEIKEVINLRTHRLASCTGKRRSSAAVAMQPIRQILVLLLLLASASALMGTAAATLASTLIARLALGCSDIALQMRRLLIVRGLKYPKKKLIIENRR